MKKDVKLKVKSVSPKPINNFYEITPINFKKSVRFILEKYPENDFIINSGKIYLKDLGHIYNKVS